MIEVTVEGTPEECREMIYRLRLTSVLPISGIYEQCSPTKEKASYFIRFEKRGDPKWSIESLPDSEGFFEAVHRYSWGDADE